MELDTVSVVLMVVFSVLAGSVIPILRNIAPRTESKIDDKALEAIQALVENRALIESAVETVQKWADPKNPSVPVSPRKR